MTFRAGLLKARGQITFIAALVISTGVIIYLEALDTEDRIQSRVAAELARQKGSSAPVSSSLEASVRTSLERAQAAYAADPAATANRAALLISMSSAVQLGILPQDEGRSGAERVLNDMERQRGEPSAVLASALGAAAIAFPALQERIAGLSAGP